MGIGQTLREAREAHGYTLDDIQVKTKIQKRYLEAIEDERYEVLPGKFYARAFMKEYALTVGLDPNELLAGFSESDLPEKEEEVVQYTRRERAKRASETKGSTFLSYLPTIIVVLLIIGIIFIAITLVQRANDSGDGMSNNGNSNNEVERKVNEDNNAANNENENNENDENNENEENEEEEDAGESEFEVVTAGDGNVPHSELNFTNPDEPIIVTLEASEDSYVDIADENEEWLYIDTVPAGTTAEVDVTDEKRILFNIGYTPTMTIKINDVELEYPGEGDSTHEKIWVNFEAE